MPYIFNVPNSKIRVAYKDLVCLLQLLRAALQDNLVLREAFNLETSTWLGMARNAFCIPYPHFILWDKMRT